MLHFFYFFHLHFAGTSSSLHTVIGEKCSRDEWTEQDLCSEEHVGGLCLHGCFLVFCLYVCSSGVGHARHRMGL